MLAGGPSAPTSSSRVSSSHRNMAIAKLYNLINCPRSLSHALGRVYSLYMSFTRDVPPKQLHHTPRWLLCRRARIQGMSSCVCFRLGPSGGAGPSQISSKFRWLMTHMTQSERKDPVLGPRSTPSGPVFGENTTSQSDTGIG